MHFLQSLDSSLFHFLNSTLANPVSDRVMPFLSGNKLFAPAVLVLAVWLIWKGGTRGRLCVLMLALLIPLGEVLVWGHLKDVIGRERPFTTEAAVHLLVPRGPSKAMPSSHAANCFAAAMIAFLYYRRSWRFMLPLAAAVAFSRIAVGVHYPSDVLAGAIIGAGYAVAMVWMLNALWRIVGRKWFSLWWQQVPSLALSDAPVETKPAAPADEPERARHWLRLGYALIFAVLLGQLVFIASGAFDLSGDEAYQWTWSKHLALSYYSKPPMIAYTQFLGTTLWGDTELGVRFFSPVIAAALGLLMLRFITRLVHARAAFVLVLMLNTTPLMIVGGTLLTIDPLSVLFWTAAMVAGWRAVQENSTARDWAWVGVWMGFGFLSKYTGLFQLLCWAVFFAMWPAARKQLRRPGPYLALAVNALFALPVIIWNSQHGWATISHVADNAKIGEPWHPTLNYLVDFIGAEAALLNPIFFVGVVLAVIGFFRRERNSAALAYLFSMGAPLFTVYLLYTLHSRVLPNWIAPSVLPLFCFTVVYWAGRWRDRAARLKPWLTVGIFVGLLAFAALHEPDLLTKITGKPVAELEKNVGRSRGWKETAQVVGAARKTFQAEGRPVFLIGDNYTVTGQLSFYLPEAKAAVTKTPLVFNRTTSRPENQFYFWPGYGTRKGENAIFVREFPAEIDPAKPMPPLPPELVGEFGSVTELGMFPVIWRGRVVRQMQMFACRDLR